MVGLDCCPFRFKIGIVGGLFQWLLSDFGVHSDYCIVDSESGKPDGHPIARVFEAMAAGMAVLVEDRLVSKLATCSC